MKTRLLLFILSACLALGFATPAAAPAAPISGAERMELVAQLHEAARATELWAQYYAVSPAELAYWHGRAEGVELAAAMLESYRAAPAAPAPSARERRQ